MCNELEAAVQDLLRTASLEAWRHLSPSIRQELLERCAGPLEFNQRIDAKEAVRNNVEHLRLAMSAAPMWTWELELNANFEDWKERLCTIMCASQGTDSREDQSRIHPDDRERVINEFMRSIEVGEACRCEFRTLLPDGSVRWSLSHGHVVSDCSDRGYRLMGVVLDITARKQLEDQFHQSQKMEAIGRLAGGVAHDFNNLLTVISGYCHVLLQEFDASDARRPHIVAIRDSGERAARLTKQLLTFSRKTISSPSVVDLNALLTHFEHLLGRMVGEHIILTMDLAPDRLNVLVDPAQMEQVVANLAVNARDAMNAGGMLKFRTTIESISDDATECPAMNLPTVGKKVVLTVSDTGIGIEPAVLSRVFEPFFTTKPVGKGTGLGLSVVHGIISQSGGKISISSQVGVGTTVRISLPFVDGNRIRVETEQRSQSTKGSETILLVDDDPTVRRIARVALETHGYCVLEAGSAEEGLALCEQHADSIKLMVTDVAMPGMGGADLARLLRQRFAGLRVLFVSGYTEEFLGLSNDLTEIDSFLAKPFKPSTLAHKVRYMLDRVIHEGIRPIKTSQRTR